MLAFVGVVAGADGSVASAQTGGTLNVVVVNEEYLTLDPAHDEVSVTDEAILNNLYGTLFYQKVGGGVGLGMASGYKFSNGNKTFSFTIRPGIRFTDGSPLTASVVAWNINRDLLPANGCDCLASFSEVKSTKAVGDQVVMQMSIPYPPILQAFVNNAPDWPASEVAIKKAMAASSSHSDEAFGQHPVGAGPFKVTSFVPNSKVDMVKNPNYYIKGEPKLGGIDFTTTPVDQSAYSALQSGTDQMVIGLSTASLIKQAESSQKVKIVKSPIISTVELNSYKPPLNNLAARQAVAYALNPTELLNIASPGIGQTVEGFIGPSSPYYVQNVAGYKGYDPAKAKQLVQKLGGLSVDIQTGTAAAQTLQASALENELSAAGIKVKITPEQLSTEDNNFKNGNWQIITGASGGTDPDIGSQSLATRFGTAGLFTCCHDSTLDKLIQRSITTGAPAARASVIHQIYQRITKESYAVPLYSLPTAVLYSPSVKGITAIAATSSFTVIIDWPTLTLSS